MKSLDALRSDLRSEEQAPSIALNRSLGWFSVALGAAEMVIPKLLARGIGIDPAGVGPLVMRAMGAREVVAGVNLLLQPRKPTAIWARVAGDALDLALLGLAAKNSKSGWRVAAAIAAVGGVTALDVIAGMRTQKEHIKPNRPIIYSVTINKTPLEVYELFRDFSRLPEFMDFLESVTEQDPVRSRWVAKVIGGKTVTWDAEIVDDEPGEMISWRSAAGSTVKTAGKVTFAKAPGRDSTEVRVEMELGFTGVGPNKALAKVLTTSQVKGDLRRLKQVLETGEVLLSDATVTLAPRPAQPADMDAIVNNDHVLKPITKPADHTNTNTNAVDAAKERSPVTSDRVNANGGIR
ncbi:MAG TPA: SRPBCC family protein [Kofleriaceae bacterium]